MILSSFNLYALRNLFKNADVIGLSDYSPKPTQGITYSSFEVPFMTAAHELKFWGIDLKDLVLRRGKDFLYSEVGLGGGGADG